MKKDIKKASKLLEESEILLIKSEGKADECLKIIAPLIDLEITDDVGMVYQGADGWCVVGDDENEKAPYNAPIKEIIKSLLKE